MKNRKTLAVAIITAIALASLAALAVPRTASQTVTAEPSKPTLTHQQEVWLYVLEWCESRGKTDAINPKDNDGTPSYYSFQFKPSTFRYYGEKYDVIPKGLTDAEIMEKIKEYDLQRAVVTQMILHSAEINWSTQFPNCVRLYGVPPKN